ncbi:hypothetical protein BS50DRAFT_594940 [Corynespora cassiicola Philippines]|uniref:SWIM-type domain-containing protein n=1 Tax=Corynespora cassiicola Philippines TaxID=1448308 RepID=A0A2T2N203_CORCC|nr:hypothetical protein BS50DRAFT_594940 [Corynespora cassiicola Philippines]
MAYFRKELEESSQYLVTPQERENMVALAYRTNPGDRETRLVQLKAQKCSCLAFQDHKIPCRHAIAVCRFFNAKPENYIAKFYEISEYREQYKYSLLAILLDDLEPDGVTKPPPEAPSRGRPAHKRMKRRTRETEARRLGNLASSSRRKEQQDEARNRYQSGATYPQQLPDTSNCPGHIAPIQNRPGQTITDQGVSTQLPDQTISSPYLISQPSDSREHSNLWQRIRAIQASLAEIKAMRERYQAQGVGAARQAVNGNRNNEHSQPHVAQASTGEAENSTLRSPYPESSASQPVLEQQVRPDEDEQQSSSGSQGDLATSQVTYIDSTVTNNTFTFGASNSVPNITINVASSPPGRNKRPMASGDEEGNNVQSEEPPALSTRSRKRARRGQS